jgi:6-phosphogluconolactonase
VTATVRVCRDAAALVDAAAALFVDSAVEAVAARGVFHVALSGGSTPRGLYERMAEDADVRARLPWANVEWWFGDERHVPPDDPRSNFLMVKDALLARAPIDPATVHRMHGEDRDADRAAREYERDLREKFRIGSGARPRFDLVWLGLGPDGHTASLFPGTAALDERTRLVVANVVPKMQTVRLTLTLPVLNAARRVAFLVEGDDKARILARVLEAPADRFPAQRVQPEDGEVVWLVDALAAQELARDVP